MCSGLLGAAAGGVAGLAPDAQAKAFEIEVLALVRLAGAAALDRGPQEGPEADGLASVVVAVGVAVALEEPAPVATFAAGVGLLLPALEDAGDGLQGGPPRL